MEIYLEPWMYEYGRLKPVKHEESGPSFITGYSYIAHADR